MATNYCPSVADGETQICAPCTSTCQSGYACGTTTAGKCEAVTTACDPDQFTTAGCDADYQDCSVVGNADPACSAITCPNGASDCGSNYCVGGSCALCDASTLGTGQCGEGYECDMAIPNAVSPKGKCEAYATDCSVNTFDSDCTRGQTCSITGDTATCSDVTCT